MTTSEQLAKKLTSRLSGEMPREFLSLIHDQTEIAIQEQKEENIGDAVLFQLRAAQPCLVLRSGPGGETKWFQLLRSMQCADGAVLVLPSGDEVESAPGRAWVVELK